MLEADCGFSAGAHNCAMYSVYWDKPEIAGFFGVEPDQLKPAACILGYQITDYVYLSGEDNLVPVQLWGRGCAENVERS